MLITISEDLAELLVRSSISDSIPINGDKELEALGEWVAIKHHLRRQLHDMQYPVRPECKCECTFCHPPAQSGDTFRP